MNCPVKTSVTDENALPAVKCEQIEVHYFNIAERTEHFDNIAIGHKMWYTIL